MVAQVRPNTDAITLLQKLEEKPYEFDFFSVLRQLECLHSEQPRFGEAARPIDEPIRLDQEPSLAFAPSTLASFQPGGGGKPHRLSVYFLGLFGPHGPLPLHLTEFARDREHNEDDPTFRRFADIFHHRLLMLFYRAWANANPAVSLDRPAPRHFDTYVGSTFGLGSAALRGRDAMPDDAKFYLSGLMGLKNRPALALLTMLEEFMQLPFRLREFVGAWMKLPPGDWSILGQASGGALGRDMVLGSSVWNCQHKFRLICGPIDFANFKRLLPGRESLAKMRDLVRNYLGDEFEWDVNLLLRSKDVPQLQLGVSGQLGWTSWLGTRQQNSDADDVIINPNSLSQQL